MNAPETPGDTDPNSAGQTNSAREDSSPAGVPKAAEGSSPPGKTRTVTPIRIFLRGLAVSLPAIVTIVVIIWIVQWVQQYIVTPATWSVKYAISYFVDDSVASGELSHIDAAPVLDHCGSSYLVDNRLLQDYQNYLRGERPTDAEMEKNWTAVEQRRIEWMQARADEVLTERVYVPLGPRAVPYHVFADVARSLPPGQVPTSSRAVYMHYVELRYFGSLFQLSALSVLLVIMLLYFLGRFVSVRVGRWIVDQFELQVLGRLPVIKNVYGSVKQVTDFVFSEKQQVEYRRVVAVQYPRKGLWSIGFVTGEGMLDTAIMSGEPVVSVLIPTSPMPMTGFTLCVPRSELLDINITVEQAMQFCISCGVLTPPHQRITPESMARMVRMGILRETSSSKAGSNLKPALPVSTIQGQVSAESTT